MRTTAALPRPTLFNGGIILVDNRAGSADQQLASGEVRPGLARYIVPQSHVRLARNLPADVLMTGWGPDGSRLEIAVEYKTIWDALRSIETGRFAANQLPNLREFDIGVLLIEGLVRRSSDARGDRLEVYGQPLGRSERGWYDSAEWGRGARVWRYTEFEHWYFTQMLLGGVYVPPLVRDKYDGGKFIGSLWSWANDKRWEEHRSHLAADKSHRAALRGELPLLVRAASEIKAVGVKGILAVERTFGSLYEAVTGHSVAKESAAAREAVTRRWTEMRVGGEIVGGKTSRSRRFGKAQAAAAIAEIRGEK